MEFAIYNPVDDIGFMIEEDQELAWAIASARIYKCENCDAWHINTDEEAAKKWIYN